MIACFESSLEKGEASLMNGREVAGAGEESPVRRSARKRKGIRDIFDGGLEEDGARLFMRSPLAK